MKKYFRFLRLFSSLVFRHYTWEMPDGTFNPPKSLKTIIWPSTAWKVAKIMHLE